MPMIKYDTTEANAKERALIERVVPKWGVIAEKNPEFHKIDYSLAKKERGPIIGFVEVKCRDCNYEKYNTFFISLAKYMAACEMTKFTGIPVFILVEWLDQTKYVKVPCKTTRICMDGRKDRGNPDDYEPMIHIPITEFRSVGDAPELSGYIPNNLNSPEVPHIDWDDDF